MSDRDIGIVIGLLIGIPLGVCLGWLIAQTLKPKEPASVIFDRDKENRIVAIHYVPGAAK